MWRANTWGECLSCLVWDDGGVLGWGWIWGFGYYWMLNPSSNLHTYFCGYSCQFREWPPYCIKRSQLHLSVRVGVCVGVMYQNTQCVHVCNGELNLEGAFVAAQTHLNPYLMREDTNGQCIKYWISKYTAWNCQARGAYHTLGEMGLCY